MACAAVIRPSFVMPILTQAYPPGAGPVARRMSERLMVSLTGRPDLRDSTAASGSR